MSLSIRIVNNRACLRVDAMHIEQVRHNSFAHSNWADHPSSGFLDISTLAMLGFYYSGIEDRVICAFCGIEAYRWLETDDVLDEHKRLGPLCPLLTAGAITRNVPIDPTRLSSRMQCEQIERPMHNAMKMRQARLDTFEHWPKGLEQKGDVLSAAGFFYAGSSDQVCCFYCDAVVGAWMPGQDPWYKHIWANEHCPFVKLVKEPKFIEAVIAAPLPDAPEPVNPKPVNPATPVSDVSEPSEDPILTCKICFDARVTAAFVPCGHMFTCGNCAVSCDSCPTCCSAIRKVLRVYFQ